MVENATDENRQDLLAELNMMKKLEPHQNVIQLLGCVTKSGLPVNLISNELNINSLLVQRNNSEMIVYTIEDTFLRPHSLSGCYKN